MNAIPRYWWTKRSSVYHDAFYAQERCNGDDANRIRGDTRPTRRLCHWCHRQKWREERTP